MSPCIRKGHFLIRIFDYWSEGAHTFFFNYDENHSAPEKKSKHRTMCNILYPCMRS